MIEIQRASESDIPALLPLVKDYWNFEKIDNFEASAVAVQLQRLLSEPRLGGGWVAMEDGVAVAYLLAVYIFSLEHLGITAEIDELFILPSQRGKGLAAKLLKTAESEFLQAGCTNASLQLSRDNGTARKLYHRHGYTERARYELLDKKLGEGESQSLAT
ncbi:GNAT family N-acetyltransferase [Agarivorans sp. QJM3NY_33]|uniref:GNAT family N-acetyltransferase n=1 Tax=Agarivorans sp. QJM3NY_33 TaxID=3421432 RepID=UPI003D7DF579